MRLIGMPMPESKPPLYRSYLIRIWRPSPDGARQIELVDAHSGERRGFSTLEALYRFLETLAAQIDAAGGEATP